MYRPSLQSLLDEFEVIYAVDNVGSSGHGLGRAVRIPARLLRPAPPCLHGAAAPELSTSVASGSWYLVYLPARPLSALCADRPKIWLPMGLQLIRLCL